MVRYRAVRRAIFSLTLLLLIACGSLFFRLGSLPLSGADEPRYARIAEEMHEQGRWVTPLLEGKPWLEKPPLLYWITIPFYSMFDVSETTARLGPAFCALITALAIFWLGWSVWSKQAGFLAGTILLTSLGFIGFGRSDATDMPFTCCFTLALALLAHVGRLSRVARREAPRWILLFAYIFLGLAVLAKGPVALILAVGIMLIVWLIDERPEPFRRWQVIPGAIIAAAVAFPWFWLVYEQNGIAFIATFLINHNLARYITEIHHHSQPFIFYLPALLALLFPWSGWLPLLISKSPLQALRRWREWDSSMVFLCSWFLFPILFFSLSDSKLVGYILPSLPPLALILGVYVSRSVDRSRLKAAAVMDLVISTAMAIAAPIIFQKEYGGTWKVGLLISAAVLIPAIFSIAFKFRGKSLHAFCATMAQGLLLVLAITQFAFPVLGVYHSTRDIAHRALELRQSGEPIITYRFFHHTLNYYTNYQVEGKLDDPHSLVQFVRAHSSCLVVTDIQGMKEISRLSDTLSLPMATQGDFVLLRITADSRQAC
jgi:4-amino-4-deoxy-L-arabinose transferase-like glycosyltransferase